MNTSEQISELLKQITMEWNAKMGEVLCTMFPDAMLVEGRPRVEKGFVVTGTSPKDCYRVTDEQNKALKDAVGAVETELKEKHGEFACWLAWQMATKK